MVELRSVYHLQLGTDFGYAAVCGLVPYFRDLGISHLRLSDRPPDQGGLDTLSRATRDAGMGILLDDGPQEDLAFPDELDALLERGEVEPFHTANGERGAGALLSTPPQKADLRGLVLKLCVPGVPVVQQGDELPDTMDWDWRQAMLRRLMGGSPPDVETMRMFATMRLLGLRTRRPELLAGAGYEPLDAGIDGCAFLRGGSLLVVVATGDPAGSEGFVSVPSGRWRDVLHGEERVFEADEPLSAVASDAGASVYERLG